MDIHISFTGYMENFILIQYLVELWMIRESYNLIGCENVGFSFEKNIHYSIDKTSILTFSLN